MGKLFFCHTWQHAVSCHVIAIQTCMHACNNVISVVFGSLIVVFSLFNFFFFFFQISCLTIFSKHTYVRYPFVIILLSSKFIGVFLLFFRWYNRKENSKESKIAMSIVHWPTLARTHASKIKNPKKEIFFYYYEHTTIGKWQWHSPPFVPYLHQIKLTRSLYRSLCNIYIKLHSSSMNFTFMHHQISIDCVCWYRLSPRFISYIVLCRCLGFFGSSTSTIRRDRFLNPNKCYSKPKLSITNHKTFRFNYTHNLIKCKHTF